MNNARLPIDNCLLRNEFAQAIGSLFFQLQVLNPAKRRKAQKSACAGYDDKYRNRGAYGALQLDNFGISGSQMSALRGDNPSTPSQDALATMLEMTRLVVEDGNCIICRMPECSWHIARDENCRAAEKQVVSAIAAFYSITPIVPPTVHDVPSSDREKSSIPKAQQRANTHSAGKAPTPMGGATDHVPDLALLEIDLHNTNSPDARGKTYSATITFRQCQGYIDGEVYRFNLKSCLLSAVFHEAKPLSASHTPVTAANNDGDGELIAKLDAQGSRKAEWKIESASEGPLEGIYLPFPFMVVEGEPCQGDAVDLICRPFDLLVNVENSLPIANPDAFKVAQKWLQDQLSLPVGGWGRAVISSKPMLEDK